MEIEQLKDIKEGRVDILCVRWSSDDAFIAAGASDGAIYVYSSGTFHRVKLLTNITETCMPISYISWQPQAKEKMLSASSDGWLVEWEVPTASILKSCKLEGEQASVCEYSPSGESFVVACRDFSLKIYNSETFEVTHVLGPCSGEKLGHSNKVFVVKWINEHFLVSGGWDRTLLLWEVNELRPKSSFFGANICGETLDVKDDCLVAGVYDRIKHIQEFRLDTLEKKRDFTLQFDDKFYIYASRFSKTPGKDFFAAVGPEVRVFLSHDLDVSERLAIDNNAYCCDWANNEDVLVVGGTDGKIVFLTVKK